MNPQEAVDTAYGTLVAVCGELKLSNPEQAEQTLDWAVQKLLDHSYTSSAWLLIDDYRHLMDLYLNGEQPTI